MHANSIPQACIIPTLATLVFAMAEADLLDLDHSPLAIDLNYRLIPSQVVHLDWMLQIQRSFSIVQSQ